MTFEHFLVACHEGGIEALELGVANRTVTAGMDVVDLLGSSVARGRLVGQVNEAGLAIGALNCFGNPLHPNVDEARTNQAGIEATIRLASELGVQTVVTASGCPGDAQWPIWITWPLYWEEIAEAQWDIAARTWAPLARLADDLGVEVCLELHPGQLVYNTSTFERLRDFAGPAIRANLDPAHLFYQGMDPLQVASRLGSSLGHVHAKDTLMDHQKVAIDGWLDTSPLNRIDRAWRYVAVGDGHDTNWWRSFLDALRSAGYGGLISIEHEDASLDGAAALQANIAALREAGLTHRDATV